MTGEQYAVLVPRLAGLRVLVVGDVSLDEYVFGHATRLSREAPIPVLEWMQREIILGGAANPARNIIALGSSTIQVGVVGDDAQGEQLRTALEQASISPAGLITSTRRPTTTKTRILSHEPPRLPQQVARIDRLDRSELTPADEQQIIAMLETHIPQVNAVLCSDYQLGLLTPRVVDIIRSLCHRYNVLLTVDAQGNSHYYRGVDLFRCNDAEATAALGRPLKTEEEFRVGLTELQARLQARLVIVTRGPDGLSLLGEAIAYMHLPATNISEVYDTTGAGDTFIAVATLALAAGIDPSATAHLANAAAAQVVRRLGNAVVTPDKLMEAVTAAQRRNI
jgi:rfaE bifunctional protein kinase chain/domain